jgi:hypothetical protein
MITGFAILEFYHQKNTLPLDSTPWEDCILFPWTSQRICFPLERLPA